MHAGCDCGEAAPVVVVVGLVAGFVEVDGAVRDLVHPLDVALDLRLVERGLVDEDGFADGDGAEGPLDLVPRLRAFFWIVVEQRAGLCPRVDLLLGALGLFFAGGDEPLIHAGGDATLEVVVDAGDGGLGGIDRAVAAAEVVWRDDHAAGGGRHFGEFGAEVERGDGRAMRGSLLCASCS